MELSDNRLDELLNSSSPAHIDDAEAVRTAVGRAVEAYTRPASRKRTIVVGSAIAGLVLAGTTAAALPSLFNDFGRVDYQSSGQYTVDGRGPFRCDFVFRVDPVGDGSALGAGASAATYEEILGFVRTHDWAFDNSPVALTTPTDRLGTTTDLGVMSTFIDSSWQAEVEAAYPNWLATVGGISGAGQCVDAADGSAP